jgi:hypothetical protein
MKFRFVFWDVLPCKIIVDRRFKGTFPEDGGSTTSETSVDNYFTRQYIPEDKSQLESLNLGRAYEIRIEPDSIFETEACVNSIPYHKENTPHHYRDQLVIRF